MENSLGSIVSSSTSALILLPQGATFDIVAAGLSLYLSLLDSKNVSISCPTQLTVEFNRLIGVNKITSELGNKNLIIKFAGYEASGIERVSYDIENGEFKLTLISKPNMESPRKDQVQFSYSGVSADLVILIDGVNEQSFLALGSSDLGSSKVIHIGVRQLAVSSGRSIFSLARVSSTVSELVARHIYESGLFIDSDVATNLLMGIEEGSKNFSDSEVTAETFEIFAKLMKSGGRRIPKNLPQRQFFPPGSIPGDLPELEKIPREGGEGEITPRDWLAPKIYKGTSVS